MKFWFINDIDRIRILIFSQVQIKKNINNFFFARRKYIVFKCICCIFFFEEECSFSSFNITKVINF